jgi:hypothetical protein
MTELTKNEIRLLIDIIRDNLPKNQRKNYSMILRSINILTSVNHTKEEIKEADEKFRNKLIFNIWCHNKEMETMSNPNSDLNSFAQEIKRRNKEQKEKEKRIDNFVKSYLKEKFKYMK